MRRTALAALAAVTSLLLGPRAAHATGPEAGSAAAPASHRIQVRIAAEPSAREALTRVLLELMQRVSVEIEVEPTERTDLATVVAPEAVASAYLALCLIDLTSAAQAALYVHDPARDRILVRRIARSPGDDELAREELGHMLLAAVEGLLAGATLGAPRSEVVPQADAERAHVAVPPPVEPASESPEARPWSFRTAVLYEAAVLGHAPGFTHGPQLAFVIRAPLEPALGLQLSAQYQLPIELPAEPVGMTLEAFPLRALAILESPINARVALRFGLGGGADVARLSPATAPSARIEAAESRTLLLGVARALVGVDVRLSRLFALWAAISADVDLDRTEYLLERDDGSTAKIAAPWRVRPALSLGVALP